MPKKKTTKKATRVVRSRSRQVAKVEKLKSSDELTALYEIADDADNYHALEVIMSNGAGDVLVEHLLKDVTTAIDQLCGGYKTLSMQDFVALSARMSAALNLVRALYRAEENREAADEALKAALQQ